MRTIQKLWTVVAGILCALGVYATSAAANAYDQVELHSGSSSGPVWSGNGVFSGTSGGFVFTGSILQITCNRSTGVGTVNSADVGNITAINYLGAATTGCPGSGGTTWTIAPTVPWSVHQLYDQTTNQFVTIVDNINVSLNGGAGNCQYVGGSQAFSDIGQKSSVLGSQTNPSGVNPGKAAFGFGSTGLTRVAGNALLCPATGNFSGTYQETGNSSGNLNIWDRNQGARVQG
jgi:hypothetical protein